MAQRYNYHGTPSRSNSNGPMPRRPPQHSMYQMPMASRSMTHVPASASDRLGYGEDFVLSGSSAPLRSRSFRRSEQSSPSIVARSMHDLSSTTVELEPEGIPCRLTDAQIRETTHRTRRFLLWNLVFAYDIHPDYFRYFLSDNEDLDNDDERYLISLGSCLHVACERMRQNQLSLLIADDRTRINEDVLVPARELNIKPEYLCEQLVAFAEHRFNPEKRHKTVLFQKATKRYKICSRNWNDQTSRTHLVQCLVSDDCVVSEIAPTEELQVVVGTCISDFSRKHCRKGLGMGSVDRKTYVQEHTRRLLQHVRFCNRMGDRPSKVPIRYGSKFVPSCERSALESLQAPFNPSSNVLREVNED